MFRKRSNKNRSKIIYRPNKFNSPIFHLFWLETDECYFFCPRPWPCGPRKKIGGKHFLHQSPKKFQTILSGDNCCQSLWQTEWQILGHHIGGYVGFLSVKFATFLLALLRGINNFHKLIQYFAIIFKEIII